MAINTRDDLIGLLEKGEMLDAQQLAEARRVTEGLFEPTTVARKLVQQKLISRRQANEVLGGRQPRIVGNYRLLDLLETPSAGPVYLALHVQMDRQVVLKTLVCKEGGSAESVQRFLDEACCLALLDHRNLCHVYDVGRDGDSYFIAMEHVAGRNLRQIVEAEGPFACVAAAGLVALAADALSHAHRQGIQHLAIRPERLLIDPQGTLKVLDTGIHPLTAARDTSQRDRSQINPDDAVFLASEQLTDQQPIDARADIYALGCVLYYVVTGRRPFSLGAVADPRLRGQEPMPDLREVRSDVPPELAEICRKMMALRPEDRFTTAADAAGALESWINKVVPPPPLAPAQARHETADVETPLTVSLDHRRKPRAAPVRRSKRPLERMILLGAGIGVVLMGIALAAMFWPSAPPTTLPRAHDGVLSKLPPAQVNDPIEAVATQPAQAAPKVAAPANLPNKPPTVVKPDAGIPAPPQVVAKLPDPKPQSQPKTQPQPTAQPKPQPDVNDPFKDLGAAVSLPEIVTEASAETGTEMAVLGKIHHEPQHSVTLSLLGGNVANDEKGVFQIQSSPTKAQPLRWIVEYQGRTGASQAVAEIVLFDHELRFRWRAESQALPAANFLRNCVLHFGIGNKTRNVAMRAPLGGNHLRFGFSKPPNREVYALPWIPKSGQMKVELLPAKLKLPSHILSKSVLHAEDDLAELAFSPPNQLPLTVSIRTRAAESLQIATTARWKSPEGKELLFESKDMDKLRNRALKKRDFLSASIADLRKMDQQLTATQKKERESMAQRIKEATQRQAKVTVPAQRKALKASLDALKQQSTQLAAAHQQDKDRLAQRINEDVQQQKAAVAAAQQIWQVAGLATKIEAAGPLPFRVVMKVDGHQVVLLASDKIPWDGGLQDPGFKDPGLQVPESEATESQAPQ